MKLPDLYTDWKIVVGLGRIMLGAANWGIGVERTQIYSRMIVAHQQPSAAATDYRSFDELDAGAGGAVLEPLTAEERRGPLPSDRGGSFSNPLPPRTHTLFVRRPLTRRWLVSQLCQRSSPALVTPAD